MTLKGIEDPDRVGTVLQVPLAATNALGTIIAYFFIDSLGRRWIILRTLPALFITLLLIALSMYMALMTDD